MGLCNRDGRAARWVAALAVVSASVCSPACKASWAPVTTESPVALQWPYPPNAPRVSYLRALSGLERNRTVGNVLASVLFGGSDRANDSFVLPVSVARGRDGRIAVADTGRNSVHFYVPGAQSYTRLTGPDAHRLITPVGVVFDEDLRLYVADSSGQVVAFGPSGEFLFALATAGAHPLRRPTGLAYSPSKRALYVVDTLANEVNVFGREGTFLFAFGRRGDGPAEFNFPTQIARSPAGEIYVTDALNFRISIFTEEGKPLGTFGRHGDGSGDFAMPRGVAVGSDGVVYVVDALFDNVQLFDRSGNFLLTIGRRGTDMGEFWLPSGVSIGADGALYVCDTYNHRIQVFRLASEDANAAS